MATVATASWPKPVQQMRRVAKRAGTMPPREPNPVVAAGAENGSRFLECGWDQNTIFPPILNDRALDALSTFPKLTLVNSAVGSPYVTVLKTLYPSARISK